jgi:hypothetical protein
METVISDLLAFSISETPFNAKGFFMRRLDARYIFKSVENCYKCPTNHRQRHQLTLASSTMMKSAASILTLAAMSSAASVYQAPYYENPSSYAYNYGVADGYSGAYYNAGEQRDGYTTAGSYSVALPDGRVQTVNYRVADANSGFVADVQYSGEPRYSSYAPKVYSGYPYASAYQPLPTYRAAAPAYVAYSG